MGVRAGDTIGVHAGVVEGAGYGCDALSGDAEPD